MGQKYYDKTAERINKVNDFVADKQTGKELERAGMKLIDDKKINVLVMGISGAGKSTLINAVLGEEKAKVGDGVAITQKMKVYESEDVMFRMVDTVGLEYNFLRQQKILKELSNWSEDGLNRKNLSKLVHCIWFCIDAQSKRVSEESLNYLYKISKMWKGVPIIVVFTKSYSTVAISDNEEMFKKVMKKYQKRKKLNVSNIVSVLARELVIDDTNIIKEYGVDNLIEATSELIPRAKEINEEVMIDWSYRMRKHASKKFVKAARRSAFLFAIMPTKAEDKEFIGPIWDNMLKSISKAYVLDEADTLTMLEKIERTKKGEEFIIKFTKHIRVLNAIELYSATSLIGSDAIKTSAKLLKAKRALEDGNKKEVVVENVV